MLWDNTTDQACLARRTRRFELSKRSSATKTITTSTIILATIFAKVHPPSYRYDIYVVSIISTSEKKQSSPHAHIYVRHAASSNHCTLLVGYFDESHSLGYSTLPRGRGGGTTRPLLCCRVYTHPKTSQKIHTSRHGPYVPGTA